MEKEQLHSVYKGYALHFGQNLYSVFSAVENEDYLHIKDIISTTSNPHTENSDIKLDFTKQTEFLKNLCANSKVEIGDDEVTLTKYGTEYTYMKVDVSDGCLVKFC